ncbi:MULTISPECIES: hypothetical protein [unclassified Pseudomonas]|uniref:hypothetical protein n=1 Tax=unclassified Pseudomonas TaxID=196821 RepID=UPI00244D7C4F|nr:MULTISPECIES: hypothetical protein [unclassified Pseudomonas]MDG9926201.1 hypothetical protein [Pseudomonas sp. GD04045]MDH0034558.1 hypothetical protein [Pseudomonas sp. GD04019]
MSPLKSAALLAATLALTGCSAAAWFKLPENSTLVINERPVENNYGLVKTRPFSWGAAGGVPYRLQDAQANTLQSGKLRSRFRVASIFWPPVAIAYWPMGFRYRCYDLTGAEPQACTKQDLITLRRAYRMHN